MSRNWPTVPLRDIIRRSEHTLSLDPDTIYSEVTVRMHGKGVVERGKVKGLQIAAGRRYQARSGQFIISRIDARHGASGLVPPELEGAVVTNDFPLFDLAADRVVPAFFGWMTKTASFVELCKHASEGTTNRVRLSEDRFYALQLPLPSLDTQQRVVKCIDSLAEKIQEARGLREASLLQQGLILERALDAVFSEGSKWTQATVDDIAESLDAGWSPQCENVPATDAEWGVLRTTAVQWCEFRPFENKRLPVSAVARPDLAVRSGDVLVTRAGPMKRVGVPAAVREDHARLMISDKLIRIRPRLQVVNPYFLEYALCAPVAQEHLVARKTGLADAQVNISQAILRSTPILYPRLEEQAELVMELDRLKSQIEAVKLLQSETAEELDAMLPAILDKAFRGELV